MENRPLDAEFVRLLHEIHGEDIPGHIYRGYTILKKEKSGEPIRHIEVITFKFEAPCKFPFVHINNITSFCSISRVKNDQYGLFSLEWALSGLEWVKI